MVDCQIKLCLNSWRVHVGNAYTIMMLMLGGCLGGVVADDDENNECKSETNYDNADDW